MPSRRRLLITCLEALALAAIPYDLRLGGVIPGFERQSAAAKDGNGNGGGNGNGNAGGNGNGSKGNGAQSESASGKSQNGATQTQDVTNSPSDAIDSAPLSKLNVELRHGNGVREKIANGQYEMRDARGRTIINRRATNADRKRFRGTAR